MENQTSRRDQTQQELEKLRKEVKAEKIKGNENDIAKYALS